MSFYLRFLALVIWFLLTCLAGYVHWIGARLRGRKQDINQVFADFFAWGAYRIIGLRVEVEGAERIDPSRPCVFVGNHQSALDLAIFGQLIGHGTVSIGKKELVWVPLFGPLFVLAENITIRRKRHRDAVGGLADAAKVIGDRGCSIFVFLKAPATGPAARSRFCLSRRARSISR